MRVERGQVPVDVLISEPYELWGSIGGDVVVTDGGKFYMRGTMYGSLRVERGGRVHIFGNINGNVIVERGAKVIHSGVISGNAINNGGRLYLDDSATVMGRIDSLHGITTGHPRHEPPKHEGHAPKTPDQPGLLQDDME